MPIGIEVEVPWKAYFPDLWVEGFPNVESHILSDISVQCTEREKDLIPRLMLTEKCGIKRGGDRYWEFALDPVTDVGIACDHIAILRQHNLIPPGKHSLHITFGGVRVTRDMYYVAMCLEALACSPDRILRGFHPTSPNLSHGWARKGYAGLFEKEGSNDVQHGMEYGSEIRLLWLPDTDEQLYSLLSIAQLLAMRVQRAQTTGEQCHIWLSVMQDCKAVLSENGLPDRNWKKPHQDPNVWRVFADRLPAIQQRIKTILNNHYGPLSILGY